MSSSWNAKESSRVDMMAHLPDDLLLNCLARVPRSYHETLSLVSKRFRSLLASTELHETRRLLGITESCLYLCLQQPSSSKILWFTLNNLSRKPTRIPRWITPSCFRNRTRPRMVSVSSHDLSNPRYWMSATVGSNIYVIHGGTSRVSVMDCRSHTWHEAPSMLVARRSPVVIVVDEKIYVLERSPCYDFSNLMEFFDPKTQKWEHGPIPDAKIRGRSIFQCLAQEGDIYVGGAKNMVYRTKENKWDALGSSMPFSFNKCLDSGCTISNVEYWAFTRTGVISPRMIQWYDYESSSWRVLKGLKALPTQRDRRRIGAPSLVNYGGNIAVSWSEYDLFPSGFKKIWCAEIEIQRGKHGHDIRGKVKWCDVVLTIPVRDSWFFKKLVVGNVC